MKKLLLLAVLIGAAVSSYGQGQIIFQNGSSTAITNVAVEPDARAVVATRVGLYLNANTLATTESGGWSLQGTTNLISPGIFFGGTRVTSFPAAQPVAVQIRAWLSATPFATYEDAILANPVDLVAGVSTVFVMTPSASPSPGVPIVGNGFQSFNIQAIPEPSSIALGLLGLGAIALFRRKK